MRHIFNLHDRAVLGTQESTLTNSPFVHSVPLVLGNTPRAKLILKVSGFPVTHLRKIQSQYGNSRATLNPIA
jgi:hypothetical protein